MIFRKPNKLSDRMSDVQSEISLTHCIVPRTKAGSLATAIKFEKEYTAMTVEGQRTQGRARRSGAAYEVTQISMRIIEDVIQIPSGRKRMGPGQ